MADPITVPSPPQKTIILDGVAHQFPADASEDEIRSALSALPPRTFLGTEDFGGRMVRYAKPLVGQMASDIAHPVLHPIDTLEGLANAALHPIDALTSLANTGVRAVQGDPAAMGHILGAAAAPKVYGSLLKGVNSAATGLAESPKLQGTAGYIGGAAGGIVGGGHPFIMGRIGQAFGPAIGSAARTVANGTGWLMDKVGMEPANTAAPVTDAERAYAGTIGNTAPEPTPTSINTTGADAWDRARPQATYVRLPDGSWGLRPMEGQTLAAGRPVNAINLAGETNIHTPLSVTPEGLGVITKGETANIPLHPQDVTYGGQSLQSMQPAVRDAILRRLAESKQP